MKLQKNLKAKSQLSPVNMIILLVLPHSGKFYIAGQSLGTSKHPGQMGFNYLGVIEM